MARMGQAEGGPFVVSRARRRYDDRIRMPATSTSGTTFAGGGWLGPGEPVVAGACFLVARWIVSVASTMLLGDDIAQPL